MSEKALTKYQSMQNFLCGNSLKTALMQALPEGTNPDRLVRSALNAILKDPLLLECSKESWARSMLEVAMLGLEVNVMGSAYMIPFKNTNKECYEVQLIPGYRGLISLACKSPTVKSITSRLVREMDEFDLEYNNDGDKLIHRPYLKGDPGEIIGAYMRARLVDSGEIQVEFMTKGEIDKVRARSKAATSGPWITDYEEMCRKTPVRRGVKYLPVSPGDTPQLARALEIEDRFEAGGSSLPIDIDITPDVNNEIGNPTEPEIADPPSRTEETINKLREQEKPEEQKSNKK